MRRLRNHAEFVGVLRRHQRVTDADIVVHYALAPENTGTEGVLRPQGASAADRTEQKAGNRIDGDPDHNGRNGHTLHDGRNDHGNPDDHKIGLAVPNSVGHAVVRNKIKRRFRVLGRKYESLLPEGYEVILRAKPSAARAEFSSLDRQVGKCFAKIRFRVENPQAARQSAHRGGRQSGHRPHGQGSPEAGPREGSQASRQRRG